MNMTEVISQYSQKSESQQAKFLSRLAHQITIFARDTYELDGNLLLDPARLRGINEIMHRIIGQQFKLLSGDTSRYPDDFLIKTIFDMATECNFEKHMDLSVTESLSYCGS